MGDRIIVSVFILIVVVLWMGVLTIVKPEYVFKTTAINTLKKKPTKAQIKSYKMSGYAWVIVGVVLIILVMTGKIGNL